MTDDQLRALVRSSVARHLGRVLAPVSAPTQPPAVRATASALPLPAQQHTSHHQYVALVNIDSACVIEPSVACDHCGYCKSHGH